MLPFAIVVIIVIVAVLLAQSGKFKSGGSKYESLDDKYNRRKQADEAELNSLLDKVSRNGYPSLSESERKRLDELSRN